MKALPNLWRWLPQPTLWSTFCNSSFLALATFKILLTDPAMNGNQPWLLKQHQIIWERGEVGVLLLFPNPYVIICIFGKFKRSKMKIGPLSIKEGCCNNGVLFVSLFCFDSLISSLLFSSFRDRQTLTLVSWWQNQWVGAVDTERQSVFVRPTIVSRVPQHLYFRHLRFCISQIFPFVFLQTLPQYLLPSTAVTLHNNSSHVKRIWVRFWRTGKTPALCPFSF